MTEVPDVTRDPRFADNELVTGSPGIRFYATAPLVTPEGQALGTLCVIDTKPRQLTPQQNEALRGLSRQVMTQLELRRSLAELERAHRESAAAHRQESTRLEAAVRECAAELIRANAQLRCQQERFRTLAEASFEGILLHDQGRIVVTHSLAPSWAAGGRSCWSGT
ncbi:MAG TPA: GAF domain-containing protein [Candidatus Sulfotelmatobacter sp.]|nr:GAF domain-containing protein [Candidatus Sulfotelmatobacter sp.]